ncbi:hypothetical protein ACTWJ8_35085 [Streptomyces sp. SDT5-1]|uniref:hypothetical protein n=1 Tax=Streptomyces sp. SDT5-1 TaxID=3406418 RepID=UPI003FD5E7D8
MSARAVVDWFICCFAITVPCVGLGMAIVRDWRGFRSRVYQSGTGPPSEAEERRYGGPVRLTGWVFIIVGTYPLVAETARLTGWTFFVRVLIPHVARSVRLLP